MPTLAHRLVRFFRHAPHTYVVGGAVRDRLLGRDVHDFDLLVQTDGLAVARHLADALEGAYVPLDADMATARVVLGREQVDIAQQRGMHLEDDLWLRDFSVNAMAIPLSAWLDKTPTVMDPVGGQADLATRLVRAVSEEAFRYDPGRLLRAPRLAAQLGGTIEPQTEQWLRRDAHRLPEVSGERQRDEFWRCLLLPGAETVMRRLDQLGLLGLLLPEVTAMQGVTQRPPHTLDVYDHSLGVLTALEGLLVALGVQPGEADPMDAAALAPYREALASHLLEEPVRGRPRWSLLKFAALVHDTGKPATRTVKRGIAHFYGHEGVGADMAAPVGERLKLSGREIAWLKLVIRHHLRPLQLSQLDPPSPRAQYRFFRDLGDAAPDLLLLSIADNRAKGDPDDESAAPDAILALTVEMLGLYYQPQTALVVAPPALVNGYDLMRELELGPGPYVGELLESIREAAAAGEVTTREEAVALARRTLAEARG
ncbi:MAG: HD domain-containing protein [Anaerolineae bacterium]|nr:HD domain-containing protein [Anaerolineae bacterium]